MARECNNDVLRKKAAVAGSDIQVITISKIICLYLYNNSLQICPNISFNLHTMYA